MTFKRLMAKSRSTPFFVLHRRNAVPYSQDIFADLEELIKEGLTPHILANSTIFQRDQRNKSNNEKGKTTCEKTR